MEGAANETLSSAFSRCVAQLGRTIRSYVVEPTSATTSPNVSPYSRPRVSSSPRSAARHRESTHVASEPQGIDMVDQENDVMDDESVVTAIQHLEPRPELMVTVNKQDATAHDQIVGQSSSVEVYTLPPSSITQAYKDKLNEFVCGFLARYDSVSPYCTTLSSWVMNAAEEELAHTLQWRLFDLTELFKEHMTSTRHQALVYAQAFVHVNDRYVKSSLALSAIGGMAMLMRLTHTSRSPEDIMQLMQCDSSTLNHQLYECMNSRHLAKYVIIGDPPDGYKRDTYYKVCVSVTARAIYGVAYTIHGANGVKKMNDWLNCSVAYERALNHSEVLEISES